MNKTQNYYEVTYVLAQRELKRIVQASTEEEAEKQVKIGEVIKVKQVIKVKNARNGKEEFVDLKDYFALEFEDEKGNIDNLANINLPASVTNTGSSFILNQNQIDNIFLIKDRITMSVVIALIITVLFFIVKNMLQKKHNK